MIQNWASLRVPQGALPAKAASQRASPPKLPVSSIERCGRPLLTQRPFLGKIEQTVEHVYTLGRSPRNLNPAMVRQRHKPTSDTVAAAAAASERPARAPRNEPKMTMEPAAGTEPATGSQWSTRTQWIFFAMASGVCAAFNGAFAKLYVVLCEMGVNLTPCRAVVREVLLRLPYQLTSSLL